MNSNRKSLVLKKETLASLGTRDLSRVAGGTLSVMLCGEGITNTCGCSDSCEASCQDCCSVQGCQATACFTFQCTSGTIGTVPTTPTRAF